MTREERTGVAIRAYSQDQEVKHRNSVFMEGLMGRTVGQRLHRKKLEPGSRVWILRLQLQPFSTARVSLSKH